MRTIDWELPLAEDLGKFSLKLPFRQFRVCQDLRLSENTAYIAISGALQLKKTKINFGFVTMVMVYSCYFVTSNTK